MSILSPFIAPAIFNIGTTEWVLIIVLVLIVFGGSKIPKLAKDLGAGIREFKNALTGNSKSEEEAEPPAPAAVPKKKSAKDKA